MDQVWAELQRGARPSSVAWRTQTCLHQNARMLKFSTLISHCWLLSLHAQGTGHSASESHTRKWLRGCWMASLTFSFYTHLSHRWGAVNFTSAIMFSEDTHAHGLAPTESSLWDQGGFGCLCLHNQCCRRTLGFRWHSGRKLFGYMLPAPLGFLHILLSR